MTGDVLIRPMRCPEYDDFDFSVYASTRLDELASFAWSADQIGRFVRMQYEARCRHDRKRYSDATFGIVTVAKEDAGRLIAARSGLAILIVDLALLPRYRSAGIGTVIVTRLFSRS